MPSDKNRDEALQILGLKTLRFENDHINDTQGVLDSIFKILSET
ncbi:MAG: DUF559 domain-containing protein [Mucilaginibacter sp.]